MDYNPSNSLSIIHEQKKWWTGRDLTHDLLQAKEKMDNPVGLLRLLEEVILRVAGFPILSFLNLVIQGAARRTDYLYHHRRFKRNYWCHLQRGVYFPVYEKRSQDQTGADIHGFQFSCIREGVF